MNDVQQIRLISLLEEKRGWFKNKADITDGISPITHDVTSQLADFFEQCSVIIREN